ncbi:MAG: hypothetical protein JW772_04555 [Candidatus Diapherotrites archaeon]|nr:hypothetical protein [Candidatus Diapherotrites archaeon]
MKKQDLKIPILLLIVLLVAVLTLTVLGLLDPLIFWFLAAASAIFAFIILPKIKQ